METRSLQIDSPPEVETSAGNPSAISGYAAVFFDGTQATEFPMPGGRSVERFTPGAFDGMLSGRHGPALFTRGDVLATFNHEETALLGRTSNGTLRLTADHRGLRYVIPFDPCDSDHARVMAKIRRGDVRGSSITFKPAPGGERMLRERGRTIREINDAMLVELGPVVLPAYAATSTELRSHDPVSIRLRLIELDEFTLLQRMGKCPKPRTC